MLLCLCGLFKIFCVQILKNPIFGVKAKKQSAGNPEILDRWEKYLVKLIRPILWTKYPRMSKF